MALAEILTPPRRMVLHHSEEMIDEGYTPGLTFLPTKNMKHSVLLNATYNNYTITNHYRSKEQIETNSKLKKTQKKLEEEHLCLQKKYKAAKTLLNRTMPLLSYIDLSSLDPAVREDILQLTSKWDAVLVHQNKRKMQEAEEQEVAGSPDRHKKQKIT